MVSFYDLGISSSLVRALNREGIIEPFEVQCETIPDALLGRDVCCRAPTGSGKTLAFGLPMLARTPQAESKRPTALILTPTRELAEQIRKVLNPLAQSIELETLSVYGGTSYGKQFRALENGVDILVACPGRLLDLLDRNALSLNDVGIVVIDEADRMADMGFMKPVSKILDACGKNRQTVLFSATLDDEVAVLIKKYLNEPVHIGVGAKEISIDSMRHVFWKTDSGGKTTLSAEIVKRYGRTILFCRTRRGVERVGKQMKAERLDCSTLHGGLNQRQRDAAMARFKKGQSSVLIATDVAARGIDIEGITCVIHFDPPENGKAYKHRSGRTARAGKRGVVISLVQKSQQRAVNRIQKEVGIKRRYTEPNIDILEEQESDRKDEPDIENSSQEKSGPRAHSFEWKNQRKGKNANKKRPDNKGGRNSRKRNGKRPEKEKPWEKNKRYNSNKKASVKDSEKSGKKKKKHFGNRPQKEDKPKHQRRNRKGRRAHAGNKPQRQ
mgnify:FL=1|jgi:superfamily II DNA/RNA helicase